MNRDFVYGVLAGVGISSLGGGLYWLVKKMKKVRLEVIWPRSTVYILSCIEIVQPVRSRENQ